jgi:hypothetical protein
MPLHSMSQRGAPGQLRGSRTFAELFSQRFRLRQGLEQHADWHILLHCALQHFKTVALKELFCGLRENMQPLRSRSSHKLDTSLHKLQAMSSPAPLRNNIQTCQPWIQIQPRRAVAENHTHRSHQLHSLMQNERRRQGAIRFLIQKLCQSGLRIPTCVKMFPLRSMQSSQLITKKWNIRKVRNHGRTVAVTSAKAPSYLCKPFVRYFHQGQSTS